MDEPWRTDYTRQDLEEIRIQERAQTIFMEPPLAKQECWIAEDPETGCRGAGGSEAEAKSNLVFAVEAYLDNDRPEIGYYSAGPDQTVKMIWKQDRSSSIGRMIKRFFGRFR